MTKELDEYESVRVEFALAFFKYINLFNMLERNIGMCISFLVNRSDPHASHPFLNRLTAHAKMDVLKDLIAYKGTEAKDGLKEDFDKWFQFAAKSKAARNRYVHGDWDIAPSLNKPIRFTPNQWNDDKDTSSNTEHMTMDEFLGMMAEMDSVFEQFSALREKYGI